MKRRREGLDASLSGTLPCVTCRYELQGLSIAGVCPECGTAVGATILALVDPFASELRPLPRPRLLGIGLIATAVAPLVAMLVAWYLVGVEISDWVGGTLPIRAAMQPSWAWVIIAACFALSSLGAATLSLQPLRRKGALGEVDDADRFEQGESITPTARWLALVGAVGLLALTALSVNVVRTGPELAMAGMLPFWSPAPERTIARVIVWLLVLGVLLALRPAARALVARSLVIRTGKVGRQTILAMSAAAAMVIVGDCLGLLGLQQHRESFARDGIVIAGAVVLFMGALMLTIGLFSSVADCYRIARSILRPGPSMEELMNPEPKPNAAGRRVGSGGDSEVSRANGNEPSDGPTGNAVRPQT